jgi:hypothetical protein
MAPGSRNKKTLGLVAGWPDEFVKKVAQNVAQPVFVKATTSEIFKTQPKKASTERSIIRPIRSTWLVETHQN